MFSTLEFSELLITRICHDLAAPVGAIYNGIEFIESEKLYDLKGNKAYELISSNSEIAANKIKFFRYIYGKSDSEGEVDTAQLDSLIQDFFKNSKTRIAFDNEKNAKNYIKLTNKSGRLTLLLATLTANCMIYGGKITIYLRKSDSGKRIVVHGISEKGVKKSDELNSIINGAIRKEITLQNIVMHLAQELASDLNSTIKVTQNENEIKFTLDL
jgi:histidine phosphotransferase ChpT